MRWALLVMSLLCVACTNVDSRPRALCAPVVESGFRATQPCSNDDDVSRPRLGYEPG